MVRSLRFLLILLLMPAAQAAPVDRVVLEISGSDDSDELRQHAEYVGVVHALPGLGKSASVGASAGYWQLRGPGAQEEFGVLRLDHQRELGPVELRLYAQQLFGADWSPTLGAAAATYRVTSRWSVAAGVDVEAVDTVIAVREHTRLDTYNVSSDYQFSETVTLVGATLRQHFSDGNQREGGLLRFIYSPQQLEGFNAQLRLRRMDSDFQGVGYFSPDRFEEGMLLLQYGHAVAGERFTLTALAGGGQQRVDGEDASAIYLAELRTRGWFNDRFGLEGKAGCSNTGDIGIRAAEEGYRYCYGRLALIAAW